MNLSPLPVQKFFDGNGRPLAGGLLFTYIPSTTTKLATYTSSTGLSSNTNPIVLNYRGEANIWLDVTKTYKFVLSPPGDSDPPTKAIWTVDNISVPIGASDLTIVLTQQILGQILYPRTLQEIAASVVPTFYYYPPGNVLRYGADPTGVASSTTAFQSATNTTHPVLIPQGSFQVSGITYAGKLIWMGDGPKSVIQCDGTLLTLTAGDYSLFENFAVENITAPLTIQRRIETTVNTTASITSGLTTITVASATGIAIGMQVYGLRLSPACLVTAVAGTTITLSKSAAATAGGVAVKFYSVTFNVGAPAIATAAQSNAAGRYAPNVNDTDVWPSLSAPQQAQAQVGPVMNLTGDHICVQGITGRHLSILFDKSSYCVTRDCELRGGWTWASIAYLNSGTDRIRNNKAIDNDIQDHGFNGVLFMACDGCVVIGNIALGVGETGFKTYETGSGTPTSTYSDTCTAVTSAGNKAIACFQGAFDYQTIFGVAEIGAGNSSSSSIGDYAAWCPFGAFGYGGSSWRIDIVAELNPGPALFAVVQDSSISGVFRENMYANLNGGIASNLIVNGPNNLIHSLRVFQDTGRWNATTGYQLAVTGGVTPQSNTSLMNCDFRDGTTALTGTILSSGTVKFFDNVRANGTPWDYLDQAFVFNITNTAGTLQHAFYAQSGALTLGNFIEKINAASSTNTNTPTGADGSTAMAAGGKIGSASTNVFWFDTADQVVANAVLNAVIIYNDTATASLLLRPQLVSLNINGVTRIRLAFQFLTAAGAAFALTAANIAAGKTIQVQFTGRLC